MKTTLECKEYRVIVEDMEGNRWDISTARVLPGVGDLLMLPGSNGETIDRVVRTIRHSWGAVQFIVLTAGKL